MFLRALAKPQKGLFIELAIKAAEANDIVEQEEKEMIKEFADEMEIAPVYSSDKDLSQILKELVKISKKPQLNEMMFEILAMLTADGEFDDKERAFADEVSKAFKINKKKLEKMESKLNEYTMLYDEICELLEG
ncbi:MAG: hypothetical protein IJS61_01665 [Firmicutes bacterium]|nr:hypothetical protein [Bacillota bacterium]